MHYDRVENYAMKCRIYPNQAQKAAIDDALTAVRVFHNCLVYDMWNQGINLTEKPDSKNKDKLIHYPNIGAACAAEYKNKLIEAHPIIKKCPQAALSTKVGLMEALKKEFGSKPIEFQKPHYYNELHPRLSYSYQESLSKLIPHENHNVFSFSLAVVGTVKVRGWNQKLRFGDEHTDFVQWAKANPKEKITVIVSKDKVGDYYLVFKLKTCLKPFAECPNTKVGVDVGIKEIAICSDGDRFENRKYKKEEKRHQRLLNRKLSRRWGPGNEVYREARKKNQALRKEMLNHPEQFAGQDIPEPLQASKGYEKIKQQHARLNRKISRKRELYNHEISRKIVEKHGFIGVETLTVSNMVRNKHLSYALTDAAFGSLLSNIKYKANWHHRTTQEIGEWKPSSKRCFTCGYIYNQNDAYHLKPWSLSIRNWQCPVCNTKHDRDLNAAKNILYYAEQMQEAI